MAKARALPLASPSVPGLVELGVGVRQAAGHVALLGPVAAFYVATDGDDTLGDGSAGNPFATLGRSFTAITNGEIANATVFLPAGAWQEAVSLPPPGVTLCGAGDGVTELSGLSGATLAWAEGEAPGVRRFRGITLAANLSGADGGDLYVQMEDGSFSAGTCTNVGLLDFDGVSAYPAIVNTPVLRIRRNRAPLPVDLAFSYDPLTATNGSLAPGHRIEGGHWGSVSYTATEAGAELEVIGGVSQNLTAGNVATIRARVWRVLGQINAADAGTFISYDQPPERGTPTLAGGGTFRFSGWVLTKNFSSGQSTQTVTLPYPPSESGVVLDRIFASFTIGGCSVSYVSNTPSTLTVLVTLPAGSNPAFTMYLWVLPR